MDSRGISIYKRGASKNWQISFYLNGKRFQKTTPFRATKSNASDALLWADSYVNSLMVNPEKVTYRQLVESMLAPGSQWLESRKARGREIRFDIARTHLYATRKHFLSVFGESLVGSVKPWEIEDHIVSLGCSSVVKNRVLYIVKLAHKEAYRKELIDTVPLIEYLPIRHAERKAFSHEQISKMFSSNDDAMRKVWGSPEYYLFFGLLATTGMRFGEALALTTDDVSTDGIVSITKAVKEHIGIGETKTKECRIAIISRQFAKAIFRYVESRDGSLSGQFIFKRRRLSLTKAFRKAMAELGYEGYVPHCLRHTYNTMLAREVLAKKMTKEAQMLLLGHKSQKVSVSYEHLTLEDLAGKLGVYRDEIAVNSLLGSEVGKLFGIVAD